MKKVIAGIQQIGIGVPDVKEAFKWYRQNFGMDIPVFEEAAEAGLMLPYTGGKSHKRHAILAINMKGGGGFEIWQYTSRTPQPAAFEIQLGDYGIFCPRIKTSNVKETHESFRSKKLNLVSNIVTAPGGREHFFIRDPFGNIFDIVDGEDWFGNGKQITGGPSGCMIGVSDIERSKKFYSEILGYDSVIYDEEDVFNDLATMPSGTNKARRVLLGHKQPRAGSFSKLLGSSKIELIKVYDRSPRKIFENRFWGDLGYIHLCFDVYGMDEIQKQCVASGHPFTVDSANSFDMGEAAGRFSYIEDPDGTLIEFVETHKIPILKKIGWYLDLRKRNPEKPLPNWMLKAMSLNRVKN
ncbi:MAG: VOC family protein [Bacteroidetes bacterium]|nr:VOC family protein [Bacteroidota bacterium]